MDHVELMAYMDGLKIRSGNVNSRNPVLLSYAAKGLLPYHGLGSGIRRALKVYPEIEFEDDKGGGVDLAG